MEFYLESLSKKPYRISSPESIHTPRLILFRDRFEYNIITMERLLQSVSPEFGLTCLWPHTKTHKSLWVTERLMAAGISSFKASPNEVDMLFKAGVKEIFVAYPLTYKDALHVADLANDHPGTTVYVQAAHPQHLEILDAAAGKADIRWPYFIDLDVGMGRTGLAPARSHELLQQGGRHKRLEFAGLHAYDGHNHSPIEAERKKVTQSAMDLAAGVFHEFQQDGVTVPKMVFGGTPGFLPDLEYLAGLSLDTTLHPSPGTWVYFDSGDHNVMGTFEVATLILAEIVDLPRPGFATLNIGHKRWSIDMGPIERFSLPGAKAVSWSEEHTVLELSGQASPNIGDKVLIAPKHVCSTVNLWEYHMIVGPEGDIENERCPVDARNR